MFSNNKAQNWNILISFPFPELETKFWCHSGVAPGFEFVSCSYSCLIKHSRLNEYFMSWSYVLKCLVAPPKHGSNYRLKSISMYKSQPYQPIKYLRFFASDNKFKLYFYSVTISLTLRLITNCFILNCWVGFSLTWFFAPEQLTIRS